jgi:hypothetical protein
VGQTNLASNPSGRLGYLRLGRVTPAAVRVRRRLYRRAGARGDKS